MEIFLGIETNDIESNIILVLYNPILSLAIVCELLNKIGGTTTIYKRPAAELSESIQRICQKLSENLNEDLVKRVYMDTDFRGQTLLRLIVNLDLEPLVTTQKVEELIEKLWVGKDTYECDGTLKYFSKLGYLSHNSFRILPGKEFTMEDLVKQDYSPQLDENFWFQFHYRRYSINYIFSKEFISAILVVIVFQFVNYRYIQSFRREDFVHLSYKKQYVHINQDLEGELNDNM